MYLWFWCQKGLWERAIGTGRTISSLEVFLGVLAGGSVEEGWGVEVAMLRDNVSIVKKSYRNEVCYRNRMSWCSMCC